MTRLCLDTSAYSKFQSEHPAVVDHVREISRIGTLIL